MGSNNEVAPAPETFEVAVEPVEEVAPPEFAIQRQRRNPCAPLLKLPLRLIVLSCNIGLSVIAFISTCFMCIPKSVGPGALATFNRCVDTLAGTNSAHVEIAWILINFAEIVISSAVLAVYILLPKWKSKPGFEIAMSLYNLIQSLMHLYFWMLGTLHDTSSKEAKDADGGMVTGVLFTQLNGCIYFSAIFFFREKNENKNNQFETDSLANSSGELASSGNFTQEQTAEASKEEVLPPT